jgi:Bifunctional DNA primase/polymerase, N-terminal
VTTTGATKRDWLHFQHVLDLGSDLLPVVPDKNATPSPLSKVKVFGKIPSAYNSNGEAHGLAKWQEREISEDEVDHWSEDRRLSMCVRTGRSGVYAIDVDLEDSPLVDAVDAVIHSNTDTDGWRFAERYRLNSNKCLFAFRIPEDHTLAKRIIDCGEQGRIEFLGLGQQFVCAGDHPSGARYKWQGDNDLPADIPAIELAEFERIWAALSSRFAQSRPGTGAPDGARSIEATGDNTLRTEITDVEEADLVEALAYPKLLAAAADNDFWSEVGYALLSLGGHGAFLFSDFSKAAPNYSPGVDQEWWAAHEGQTPRSDFRHVFTLARRLGWRNSAEPADFPIVEPPSLVDEKPTERTIADIIGHAPLSHYQTTDLSNAKRLHETFAGKKLLMGRGCFHEWTGTHWQRDEAAGKRCALHLSSIVLREADELRPKLEALIEAAPPDLLADFEALQNVRRGNRPGNTIFKRIGKTDLWLVFAAIENLEVWSRQCENESTQAAAVRLLRTVMEIL